MSYLKNSIYSILPTIIFIVIISSTVIAQNPSYLDSLSGKYALQFQISDNFNLTNFQGTTLSGKYNFGCRSAVRAGLTVNFNNSDAENTETLLDTNIVNTTNANQNIFGLTLRTQYIHYVPAMYDILFFFGGGPFVGFNSGTSESNANFNEPIHRKETLDDFYTGLDAIVGVEWFFDKSMSLSAEYGLRFSYNSSSRKLEEEHIIRETTFNRTLIEGGDINFGLSVYF